MPEERLPGHVNRGVSHNTDLEGADLRPGIEYRTKVGRPTYYKKIRS